jgi:methylmalonyl-CoA carboxyltransferase 12S subunit
MEPIPVDWTRALGALEELRRELSRLGERVAALEAAGVPTARPESPPPVVAPAPERSAAPAELDEELIVVISSAIAAFLGKKPHIRQIRLIGSAAWAQQGRVTIQASHALSAYSGRS